jgi:tetratricopeptide (TPR) repeat protein
MIGEFPDYTLSLSRTHRLLFLRYSLNFVKLTAKRRARVHKVPAEEIADLLIEHGVRVVTMNACESAKVLDSGSLAATMASVLVQKGIQAVVATSFRAMDSSMELFISFLYLKLLVYDLNLHDSVALARKELLDQSNRRATLGRKVDLMDYVVPVVYRRQDIDIRNIQIKAPQVPSADEARIEDAWRYMTGFMDFLTPIELVGRDQDISLVETLLDICPIVLLHGQGGIGKSALLRHFEWWWRATGLVQWVVHLDFADTPEPCLTMQDLKDGMVKKMLGFEGFLGDGESADAKNVTKFFQSNSCLLVLDSLDILTAPVDTSKPKMAIAEQRKVRRFLEDLVQSDGDNANSYILLASRSSHAFTWDVMEEITSYKLTGLPIIHCLAVGWRAASRYTQSKPNFGTTSQDIDYLERIAEIVNGNPLAIELIFPAIVDPGVTPRVLFDAVLTGTLPMKENPKPWSHFRFSRDVVHFLKAWNSRLLSVSESMKGAALPLLLAPFNNIVPRALDIYAFLNYRLWVDEETRSGLPDLDVLITHPEITSMLRSVHSDNDKDKAGEWSDFFVMAEAAGMISPLEHDDRLLEDSDLPEYYEIHPVFTLWLRQEFLTMKTLADGVVTSYVEYYIWWNSAFARSVMANVPRHEWDNQTIKAMERNGRWNLIASVIHAQEQREGQEVTPHEISPVARVLIPIAPLLQRFPELSVALRPYLEAELIRHLAAGPVVSDSEALLLYTTLKLAYCLRYAGVVSTWGLIEQALNMAEAFVAIGGKLLGMTELTFMETRTTQAVTMLELDTEKAVHLFERNLRYEPQSRDESFPSIKRDVYHNLGQWSSSLDALEREKRPKQDEMGQMEEGTQKASNVAERLLSMMLHPQEFDASSIDTFRKEKVKDSWQFKHRSAESMSTFSNLAQSILNSNMLDVTSDLTPDNDSLNAYVNNQFASQSRIINLSMAAVLLAEGDSKGAEAQLHKDLHRQLATSNDAPTNAHVHNQLYKLALANKKWLTAIEHLTSICSLADSHSIGYGMWLEFATCYDNLQDFENVRTYALKALRSARQFYNIDLIHSRSRNDTSASNINGYLRCLREVLDLRCISSFACIAPKRAPHDDDDPHDDDMLNVLLLLDESMSLIYLSPAASASPEVPQDGTLFALLNNAVSAFTGLYLNDDGSGTFTLPPETAPELMRITLDIHSFNTDIQPGVIITETVDGKQAASMRVMRAYKEAEECLYSHKRPQLEVLADSKWAKEVLDRRLGSGSGWGSET